MDTGHLRKARNPSPGMGPDQGQLTGKNPRRSARRDHRSPPPSSPWGLRFPRASKENSPRQQTTRQREGPVSTSVPVRLVHVNTCPARTRAPADARPARPQPGCRGQRPAPLFSRPRAPRPPFTSRGGSRWVNAPACPPSSGAIPRCLLHSSERGPQGEEAPGAHPRTSVSAPHCPVLLSPPSRWGLRARLPALRGGLRGGLRRHAHPGPADAT